MRQWFRYDGEGPPSHSGVPCAHSRTLPAAWLPSVGLRYSRGTLAWSLLSADRVADEKAPERENGVLAVLRKKSGLLKTEEVRSRACVRACASLFCGTRKPPGLVLAVLCAAHADASLLGAVGLPLLHCLVVFRSCIALSQRQSRQRRMCRRLRHRSSA